jgi:hypothetical protein
LLQPADFPVHRVSPFAARCEACLFLVLV